MGRKFQLELIVHSAEELKDVRHLAKMQTYAMVWIDPNIKYVTSTDTTGGVNPYWNDKFVFIVNEEDFTSDTKQLHIEIYTDALISNKFVGKVEIPLIKVYEICSSNFNKHHYMTQKIESPFEGKLNLSFLLTEKEMFKKSLSSNLQRASLTPTTTFTSPSTSSYDNTTSDDTSPTSPAYFNAPSFSQSTTPVSPTNYTKIPPKYDNIPSKSSRISSFPSTIYPKIQPQPSTPSILKKHTSHKSPSRQVAKKHVTFSPTLAYERITNDTPLVNLHSATPTKIEQVTLQDQEENLVILPSGTMPIEEKQIDNETSPHTIDEQDKRIEETYNKEDELTQEKIQPFSQTTQQEETPLVHPQLKKITIPPFEQEKVSSPTSSPTKHSWRESLISSLPWSPTKSSFKDSPPSSPTRSSWLDSLRKHLSPSKKQKDSSIKMSPTLSKREKQPPSSYQTKVSDAKSMKITHRQEPKTIAFEQSPLSHQVKIALLPRKVPMLESEFPNHLFHGHVGEMLLSSL